MKTNECLYVIFLNGRGGYWCNAALAHSAVSKEVTFNGWIERMNHCEGFSLEEGNTFCKYFKEKETTCTHRRLRKEARLLYKLEEL